MKQSIYNYETALPDDTNLFFNFYTLSLMVLDSSESEAAKRILKNPSRLYKRKKEKEIRQLFLDHGFIIPHDIDEIELLKQLNRQSRSDRSGVSLTIAPTLNCNFQCTYCYENPVSTVMSREVEDAIVRYVDDSIEKNGNLSVTWFGGEPLLCMGTIERLSSCFIDLCDKRNVSYSASIVTNGYLLNKETAGRLCSAKVNDVQVTLDGPPEIHNQRRPKKGGGGTFFRILDNISTASENLGINIRMNVDDRNRDHIIDLLEILNQKGLEQRVGFYLGWTYPYTDACSDMAGFCLASEDFTLLTLETAMEMVDRRFGSFPLPKSTNYYCMADKENSYAITPAGALVKCWNEISNPDAAVSHLLKPTNGKMKKNVARWNTRNPFDLECAECRLLPICMGGCPYLYQRTGQLQCHNWKYHLKESLCFYFYLKKINKESEFINELDKLAKLVKEQVGEEET